MVAAVSLLLAAIALTWGDAAPAPAPIEASPSPSPQPEGQVLQAKTLADLPATLLPYPFTEPAPEPVATEIDGTYMLILTLDDLGGASHALPFPCRRCLPYARDPGVMTLIFFRGAYFVDHQMSSFHSTGHYEVDGDRLTLFNDPNCSRDARNVHVGAGERFAAPRAHRRHVRVRRGAGDRPRDGGLDADPCVQA